MDLSGLNKEQKNAVTNSMGSGVTALIAGAGAGKTKTLTVRAGYLVDDMGIDPENIMLVTFTRKAANELVGRLSTVVEGAEKMWVGTFHALCIRILKIHIHHLGVDNDFTIMSPYNALKLITELSKMVGIPFDKELMTKYRSRISSCKNNLIKPEEVISNAKNEDDIKFGTVYRKYQDYCWRNRTFDFDDVILYTVVLLQKFPQVQQWCTNKFKYIMVDESQDTNKCQFELIKLLLGNSNNNLFMVGDDAQSIYGFRDAKPEYIYNIKNIFRNAQVMFLNQNYRSTKVIVQASNALINNNEGQYIKNCFTDNKAGEPIYIRSNPTPEEEAEFVAREVELLKAMHNTNYENVAVLFRTNSQSRNFEEAFIKYKIPYKILDSTNFYERAEIKDIMSFVRVIVNNKDIDSFGRAMKALPNVGDAAVQNLIAISKENGVSCVDALQLFKRSRANASSIMIASNIFDSSYDKPSECLEYIANNSGILAKLKKLDTNEARDKIDNIKELINAAVEYEEKEEGLTLSDFVNNISVMSIGNDDESKGQVNMMTIHASKGLEYENVFLVGTEDGILPHGNCIKTGNVSEERRVAYVGMTRAKDKLYITYSNTRNKGKKDKNGKISTQKTNVSRFVKEIPSKYVKVI